jgi:transcriptional regulator with XRE-family HTH domain
MSGDSSLAPHEAFGRCLRQARRDAGMSQEQLGLEADVQRNFISLIELGQNQPTITTVFKLAKALNVPASSLVIATEVLMTNGMVDVSDVTGHNHQ